MQPADSRRRVKRRRTPIRCVFRTGGPGIRQRGRTGNFAPGAQINCVNPSIPHRPAIPRSFPVQVSRLTLVAAVLFLADTRTGAQTVICTCTGFTTLNFVESNPELATELPVGTA